MGNDEKSIANLLKKLCGIMRISAVYISCIMRINEEYKNGISRRKLERLKKCDEAKSAVCKGGKNTSPLYYVGYLLFGRVRYRKRNKENYRNISINLQK